MKSKHRLSLGDCGSHGTKSVTTLQPSALAYTPDTKPNIDKQVVVSKTQDEKLSAKLTTYGDLAKSDQGVKKQVKFADRVKVRCINPKCGRTSILG